MCENGHDDILTRINDLDYRVGEVKELASENQSTLKLIHKCVAGSIGNGDDKPGLIERVRMIEKWIDTRVWFERLVISIVVAQIIALIFIALNLNELLHP